MNYDEILTKEEALRRRRAELLNTLADIEKELAAIRELTLEADMCAPH